MTKARIVRKPTGLLSVDGKGLVPWPDVGETVDLPASVVEAMAAAGDLEIVETRPAPKAKVEKRAAKKP